MKKIWTVGFRQVFPSDFWGITSLNQDVAVVEIDKKEIQQIVDQLNETYINGFIEVYGHNPGEDSETDTYIKFYVFPSSKSVKITEMVEIEDIKQILVDKVSSIDYLSERLFCNPSRKRCFSWE